MDGKRLRYTILQKVSEDKEKINYKITDKHLYNLKKLNEYLEKNKDCSYVREYY